MFVKIWSGSRVLDGRWSTGWKALSRWMVVSDAWPTAPCHRSVTRTTTGLLTRHGHARLCCWHFQSTARHCTLVLHWVLARGSMAVEYPRQLPSPPCAVELSFWQDVRAQHSRHSAQCQLHRHRRRQRLDLVESKLLQRRLIDASYASIN